jgi:hypothetical protein
MHRIAHLYSIISKDKVFMTCNPSFSISGFSLLLTAISFSQILHAGIFAPVVGTDLTIGRGYNSLTGQTGGNCVKVSSLVTSSSHGPMPSYDDGSEGRCSPSGQCVEFKLTQINSSKELRQALNLDAKASFGLGPFSADASYRFYEENKYSSNNIYLFLRVKVTNVSETLREFELTSGAWNILQTGNLAKFLSSCGDSFISGRTTGGEFSTIIQIGTTSTENKKDIEAQLRAGGFGWSANGSVQESLAQIRRTNTIRVDMFKRGGIGSIPNHSDIEGVFEYARNLPTLVQSNRAPHTYLLTSTSYDVILDTPSVPQELSRQVTILEELASNRDLAFERWAAADYISRYPKEYMLFNPHELDSYKANLNTVIRNLSQSARTCEQDSAKCNLPEIKWPQYVLPIRTRIRVPKPVELDLEQEVKQRANQYIERQVENPLPHSESARLGRKFFFQGINPKDGRRKYEEDRRSIIEHQFRLQLSRGNMSPDLCWGS